MATLREQMRPAPAPKYDAYVQEQLSRARGRIRTLDVIAAFLGLLALTLSFALVMVLLDRQYDLSLFTRQLSLLGCGLGAGVLLALGIIRPLCWRINLHYAAREVERTLPGAKNSIINWLDLHDQTLPAAIHSSLSQRAARDLGQADLEKAISSRRVLWLGGFTGALALGLFLALLTLGFTQFGSLLERAFAPFDGSAIAKRTQLILIRPTNGDAVVPVGHPVNIAVEVAGRKPRPGDKDALVLHFRYEENEPYEEQLLEPETEDLWTATVPPAWVRSGFWYKITGGDDETPEYRITVRSAPLITGFEVTYHYRPYLRWPDATTRDGNLKDLRGTEANILVRTNRTIKEGRLELALSNGPKKNLPAELVPDDPQALRCRLVLDQDGQYRVWFTSVEGEKNSEPMPYTITVLSDRPPRVELIKPGQDLTLPANGTLPLEGLAEDDFGVTALTLRLKQVSGPSLQGKTYREGKSFQLVDGTYPRKLDYNDFVALDQVKTSEGQPFSLAPGMVLEYWLEAVDNCDFPGPNRAESKHFKLTIADPQPEPKKQQEREQASQQKKQHEEKQDQKIEEENQQRKDTAEPKQDLPAGEDKKEDRKPESDPKKRDDELERKAEKIKEELQRKEQAQRDSEKGEAKKEGKPQEDKGEAKGDKEAQGQGDKETGRQGDKEKKDTETRKNGDKEKGKEEKGEAKKDDPQEGAKGEPGDGKKENGTKDDRKTEAAKDKGDGGAKPDQAQGENKGQAPDQKEAGGAKQDGEKKVGNDNQDPRSGDKEVKGQGEKEKGEAKKVGSQGEKEGEPGQGKKEEKPQDGQKPQTGEKKGDGGAKPDQAQGENKGQGAGQEKAGQVKQEQPAAGSQPEKGKPSEKGEAKGAGQDQAAKPAEAKKETANPQPNKGEIASAKGPGPKEPPGEKPPAHGEAKGDPQSQGRAEAKKNDPGGEPKTVAKQEGKPDPQEAATRAQAKSGGEDKKGSSSAKGDRKSEQAEARRGPDKDKPGQGKKPEEVAGLEKDLQNGTPQQREAAARKLEELSRSGQDQQIRKAARRALEQERQAQEERQAATAKAPPSEKDPKTGEAACGQCKGGKDPQAGQAGASKSAGAKPGDTGQAKVESPRPAPGSTASEGDKPGDKGMAKGPGQREDTPGEDRAEGPAPATEGAKPGEKEAAPNQATQGGSKPGSGKEKTDRAQAQGEKPGEGPGGKKPDKGEKPAETRADRGQQNPGNPETGGLKDPTGEGVPPDRVVKEPDLPKSPADPEHRKRAGALQVEDFTKIDKTILKKLKMSEEELRAFQKAYTEKLQRQETEKLAPPQSGNLRNLGARELKGAPGKASDVRRGGLGQPPPEFRDLFRKYTSNTKH